MNIVQTRFPYVLIVEPRIFSEARGFNAAVGREVNFVQDNHSRSLRAVLRGLHDQLHQPQAKLVRVTRGCVFDVAVDLRRSLTTFWQSVVTELSEDNYRQVWIPEGFAHGFLLLSEYAGFLYKASDFYAPTQERCLLWNDAALKIDWPLQARVPALSAKDAVGLPLRQCELFA